MRRRVIVVGLVVLSVVVLGGLLVRAKGGSMPPAGRAAGAGPAAVLDPVPVVVATAARTDAVSRVLATGSVTSIRDAKLGSKISGRVAAVLVDEGARVTAGTPLLQIDTSDLRAQEAQARATVTAARARLQEVLAGARPEERQQSVNAVAQAEAGYRSAQSSLSLAEANAGRMRALQAQGAVSRQDLDTAETQERVAQAQVAQAQAAYDSARQSWTLTKIGSRQEDIDQARAQLTQAQAGLAAVEVQLRDSTLRAPFSGTITKRMVEPGETVSSMSASAGSPLFVLSEMDDVYVEFIVPAQHRFELRPGEDATMSVDGLPGRTFQGRVEDVRPAADAINRTFGVKVRVPNASAILRPGMFARGTIIVGVRRGVLQIPEQAVMTASSGSLVFVVRDGTAVRRPVTLGAHQDGLVEVTSGLSDGEKVVVRGQDALTDNQPVSLHSP